MAVALVNFYFLSPKQVADLLGYDHKGLKTFLYLFGDSFEQGEALVGIFILDPEHFSPDFIGGDKKSHADGLDGCSIYSQLGFYNMAGGGLGVDPLHPGHEVVDEGVVEDGGGVLGERVEVQGVDGGVQLQPDVEQIHEHVLAGEVGVEEDVGLGSPLLAQLLRELLQEDAVPVELVDLLVALEQLELRIVVGLAGLRPVHLVLVLRSVRPLAVPGLQFLVHRNDVIYII